MSKIMNNYLVKMSFVLEFGPKSSALVVLMLIMAPPNQYRIEITKPFFYHFKSVSHNIVAHLSLQR